ncbi:endonuclease III domain-containing protein [Desulfosoma caldarium]|uniref:DNA-(Apurinic or apyrimidinic site) lyase /endonuclease III n=1 Tax=Desulfosoma caldarium TaxID=610254 RepID=A0A3N1VN53_9BACT|nr:endonuclease III [Desulfosoma caldarium]ROR01632.1 DNA-(apurinic or apyrimidinic site) lyase /endonuclease III [Desulfosoma caldarium]
MSKDAQNTETLDEKLSALFQALADAYGLHPWNWHTNGDPFRVLVGTLLSHRTRDARTDEATRSVLERYKTARDLAEAPEESIASLVRPVNYYKTKARRLKEVAQCLVARHGGQVPDNAADLMALPGVGPKTAACVLVYGFHRPAIPVDVHVHRISNRLGLVTTRKPEETQKALERLVPTGWFLHVNELLVKHGQTTCLPRHPKCDQCVVRRWCAMGQNGRSQ